MNTNDSFVKVYEFLLENAPETAHDVYEGLEMLDYTINLTWM